MILTIKFENGGTKKLYLSDAPKEEDAFKYLPNYAGSIEVFLTKGKKETATSGNHRKNTRLT